MSDLLDPAAILARIPQLLPQESKSLSNAQDAIAAEIHATLTVLDFRLVGCDDSGTSQTIAGNVFPANWNQNGPGSYALRYRHDQSSLEYLIKVGKLGTRTVINAIALESDKAESLDISTNDFISPAFFPSDLAQTDAPPLIHGFISSNRVADFISQFRLKILQKLLPGLSKTGYAEVETAEGSSAVAGGPTRATRPRQPDPPQPHSPYDEFGGGPPSVFPRGNPLQIGRRDLDPLGGLAPNPLASQPYGFDPLRNDGMFVGPNHPIFGGRGPGGVGSGQTGPWGGDGFLPPLGAPPGARFDPIGPGVGPSFPGNFGRGRGAPRRLGEPDNDEFLPPGHNNDDMYM